MKTIDDIKAATIEVVDRVKSETPPHFKKVRKIGYVMMGIGGVVKLVGIIFPPLLPAALLSFAGDILGYGAVMAGVATTARK